MESFRKMAKLVTFTNSLLQHSEVFSIVSPCSCYQSELFLQSSSLASFLKQNPGDQSSGVRFPNLAIFTEYQKWVDEQSDLVDVIMGMYQLEKNSSSDVEDEEKEERMSTWVNSLTI